MISLVIIARNEERSIERCIASFRESIDEIILCDTGSMDNTISIASSLGASIYHYSWSDDFSAARNFAIEKAKNPYILMVDADEWLLKGEEEIRRYQKHLPHFVGKVKVVNQFLLRGHEEISSVWISRLFPKGILYSGPIHEQLVHNLPEQRTAIVFGHDGYLPQQKTSKKGRNELILRKCLDTDPDDFYYNYQLGKELENSGQFLEASKYYKQALDRVPNAARVRHDIIVRSIFTFKKAGLFDDMLKLFSLEEFQYSADYHFATGDAWLDYAIAFPDQAYAILPRIEEAWLRCLLLGDNKIDDDAVVGRGSFLAAENLYSFYSSLGDERRAQKFKEKAALMRKKMSI